MMIYDQRNIRKVVYVLKQDDIYVEVMKIKIDISEFINNPFIPQRILMLIFL